MFITFLIIVWIMTYDFLNYYLINIICLIAHTRNDFYILWRCKDQTPVNLYINSLRIFWEFCFLIVYHICPCWILSWRTDRTPGPKPCECIQYTYESKYADWNILCHKGWFTYFLRIFFNFLLMIEGHKRFNHIHFSVLIFIMMPH